MKPYFNGPERTAKLVYHSELWVGTPWAPNSSVRGVRGGVACHNLPRAILVECGALPKSFPLIQGDPTQTRHKKESVMVPWVDARPELQRVEFDDLKPGDVLGLRIYHCVDHLALMLPGRVFIHVLVHKNTCFDSIDIHPWKERLGAAWRIMEN